MMGKAQTVQIHLKYLASAILAKRWGRVHVTSLIPALLLAVASNGAKAADTVGAAASVQELSELGARLSEEIGRLAAALEHRRAQSLTPPKSPAAAPQRTERAPALPIEVLVVSRCQSSQPGAIAQGPLCAKAKEVQRLREAWEAESRRYAAMEAERNALEETRRAAVEAEATRARADAERRRVAEERRRIEAAEAQLGRGPYYAMRVAAELAARRHAAAEAEAQRVAAEEEARRIIEQALRVSPRVR
jgi:fused signal recognition particle receptor